MYDICVFIYNWDTDFQGPRWQTAALRWRFWVQKCDFCGVQSMIAASAENYHASWHPQLCFGGLLRGQKCGFYIGGVYKIDISW